MRKILVRHSIFLLITIALIVLSGCSSQRTQTPAAPSPSPSATMTATPSTTQPTGTAEIRQVLPGINLPGLIDNLPTRTPAPTATPDALAEGVDQIIQRLDLSRRSLLWIQYEDWFNLGLSVLLVIAGYLIGTWLIRWVFPRLVKRTKTVLDDRLLATAGDQVRWLAVLLILQFATNRLSFIQGDLKTVILDLYFLLSLWLIVLILWRLTNLAAQEAATQTKKAKHYDQSESLIVLFVWVIRMAIIILGLSVLLTQFGFNITGLAIFLIIATLVISLAGRDVLADVVSGAMILLDRPYRIGDRIDLPVLKTWGNVVDIGVRSTRVLTLNNRMVILPNSKIGKDEIVNYSYPDPWFYDVTDIGVAYENDPEKVEQLLKNAVGSVDGVQKERSIDVRLESFTRDQMIFRVGWWMKNVDDYYTLRMLVNRAIIQAMKENGVVLPYRKGRFETYTDEKRPNDNTQPGIITSPDEVDF